jgi:hypothetical protein
MVQADRAIAPSCSQSAVMMSMFLKHETHTCAIPSLHHQQLMLLQLSVHDPT